MQLKIYSPAEHLIDHSLVDLDALYVLQRLHQAGFTAYLVGGSVRDLLINQVPKDYDISTSARPEQVKALFQRQCILIGKRFLLAHIRFGHKVIEVATFRGGENESDLITRDNQWGTPIEDVMRRDFTVNGLFYDAHDRTIIDYVDGVEDIKSGLLRTIGNPEVRFKQDPVRILRLLKFHARYGFKMDQETEAAIKTCSEEIVKSSPARILEEILRMLESGASAPFFQHLASYGILPLLFPRLMQELYKSEGKRIFHYLACADQIHHHKKKKLLDRSVLTACLIYPLLEKELKEKYLSQSVIPHLGDVTLTTYSLIKSLLIHAFSHFPRKITSTVAAILIAQYRLTPLSGGKRHLREKLFHYKEFELALTFLKIRALVDGGLVETYTSIRNQYHQYLHQGGRKHHHPPDPYQYGPHRSSTHRGFKHGR